MRKPRAHQKFCLPLLRITAGPSSLATRPSEKLRYRTGFFFLVFVATSTIFPLAILVDGTVLPTSKLSATFALVASAAPRLPNLEE